MEVEHADIADVLLQICSRLKTKSLCCLSTEASGQPSAHNVLVSLYDSVCCVHLSLSTVVTVRNTHVPACWTE